MTDERFMARCCLIAMVAYGPETAGVRSLLRQLVAAKIRQVWPGGQQGKCRRRSRYRRGCAPSRPDHLTLGIGLPSALIWLGTPGTVEVAPRRP